MVSFPIFLLNNFIEDRQQDKFFHVWAFCNPDLSFLVLLISLKSIFTNEVIKYIIQYYTFNQVKLTHVHFICTYCYSILEGSVKTSIHYLHNVIEFLMRYEYNPCKILKLFAMIFLSQNGVQLVGANHLARNCTRKLKLKGFSNSWNLVHIRRLHYGQLKYKQQRW